MKPAPLRAGTQSVPLRAGTESVPLRATGLLLALGGQRVLDQVSLDLPAGQWTAIVGPNGAGKSSLLSVLAGLRHADAGQVLLQGKPIAHWPAQQRARELAWLSQHGHDGGAEGEIAVRDVVRLGRLPRHGLFGAPDAADETAVNTALAETQTTAFAERRLSELSGGERQRVLLARVLAVQAGVLLLDEPTTHLDAPHQRALVRSLRQRARDGMAVAAVLHDLNLALAADRLVVMQAGRVVVEGQAHEPALHAALARVFEQAFSIEAVQTAAGPRWVAVPAL